LILNARNPHSSLFYETHTRPEPRIAKLHPDPIAHIVENLQHSIDIERGQRLPCCSGVQIYGRLLDDDSVFLSLDGASRGRDEYDGREQGTCPHCTTPAIASIAHGATWGVAISAQRATRIRQSLGGT